MRTRSLGTRNRREPVSAFAEGIFTAYFLEGRNIADRSVLVDIAVRHGFTKAETHALLDDADERRRTREDAERTMKVRCQEAFRCTSSMAGRPFQELRHRRCSVAQSSERSRPLRKEVWHVQHSADERRRGSWFGPAMAAARRVDGTPPGDLSVRARRRFVARIRGAVLRAGCELCRLHRRAASRRSALQRGAQLRGAADPCGHAAQRRSRR